MKRIRFHAFTSSVSSSIIILFQSNTSSELVDMDVMLVFPEDQLVSHLLRNSALGLLLTLPCSFSKSTSRSGWYGPRFRLKTSWMLVPEQVKAISVCPSRHPFWKRICLSSCGLSRYPV